MVAFDFNKCKEGRLPTNCTQGLSSCHKGICVCIDLRVEYPHQRCHKNLPSSGEYYTTTIKITIVTKFISLFADPDECPLVCECNVENGSGCDQDLEDCIDGKCYCKTNGELVLPQIQDQTIDFSDHQPRCLPPPPISPKNVVYFSLLFIDTVF